jgi:hypothetical protein
LTQQQSLSADEQYQREAKLLSALIHVENTDRLFWTDAELADVFRHQMTAPLKFDLKFLAGVDEQNVAAMAEQAIPPAVTFADLLGHAAPPLELLRLVKEFAKVAALNPSHAIPKPVATMLYYAAIAAALVRLGQRLTDLKDDDLRAGLQWGAQQRWADDATRQLVADALLL